MPTLIATVGAENANSYATKAEADAYHDVHLYAATWTDADDDNRKIALIMATRILDEVCEWQGEKLAGDQALRWPRWDVYDKDGFVLPADEIPVFLKNATAELARHLLAKDRLQTMDDAVAGLTKVKAGSVEVEFDKMDRMELLPPSVLNMVKDFSTSAGGGFEVPLVRV